MQSEVAMVEVPPLSKEGHRGTSALQLRSFECASCSIVWISYLGLISVAVAVMGW